MKFLVVLALVAVAVSAKSVQKRQVSPQNPLVWDALRILRGNKDLTTEDILSLVAAAVPGQDYPINAQIPQTSIVCSSYKQAGYYADTSAQSKCQSFVRCDENGVLTQYLCGNGSLFNQITLVCDWYYNVDCSASSQFDDYSNSRIGIQDAVLLDNEDNVAAATGAVQSSKGIKVSGSAKSRSPKADDASLAVAQPAPVAAAK
jgi:hypothetical protein